MKWHLCAKPPPPPSPLSISILTSSRITTFKISHYNSDMAPSDTLGWDLILNYGSIRKTYDVAACL